MVFSLRAPVTLTCYLLTPITKGTFYSSTNYRGIALLEILSKVYVNILNKRLTFFSNAYDKIAEAQAGFRSGYSTIDNGFILYSIVNKHLCKKGRKLYVAFIDFKKAFDSVDRCKMFSILTKYGVKGHLLESIKNIYNSVKACVRNGSVYSDVFDCPIGLRQGCNLSPMLFSLFINELYMVMKDSGITGIQLTPDTLQILMLLFADDVALTADTVNGLQQQLNVLNKYCQEWKLSVNIQKTKILVFKNGGNLSKHEKWFYEGERVEVVNGFSYVGLFFSSKLSMYKMSECMANKAKRVTVSLLSSLNHLMPMSKTAFFKLFDAKIAPYYCMVRSFGA